MDLASAAPVESLDLFTAHRGPHDPREYATNLARYLIVRSRLRPIALASGTQIYLPRLDAIPTLPNAYLEIVGSTAEEGTGAQGVAQARQAVIGEVRRLPPSVFETVEIDSLVHRHLIGRKGSKVRQYEKDHSVDVVFPPPESGRSDVLLVYTGEHFAGPEAKAALDQVKAALEALAGEFADLTTATVEIPTTLHGAVIGQGGTTLNAVIGEDKLVHVQFGDSDEVTVRGPKDEVERVCKELERITLDARNEEIVNSHVSRMARLLLSETVPTNKLTCIASGHAHRSSNSRFRPSTSVTLSVSQELVSTSFARSLAFASTLASRRPARRRRRAR